MKKFALYLVLALSLTSVGCAGIGLDPMDTQQQAYSDKSSTTNWWTCKLECDEGIRHHYVCASDEAKNTAETLCEGWANSFGCNVSEVNNTETPCSKTYLKKQPKYSPISQ